MDRHYDILGYLFIGYGALLLVVALFVGAVLSAVGTMSGDPDAMQVLGAVSGLVGVLLFVFGLPYVLAGYGLLKRFSWGRILALILGGLALFSIPIGTALGIYTLWALLQPEAQDDFV